MLRVSHPPFHVRSAHFRRPTVVSRATHVRSVLMPILLEAALAIFAQLAPIIRYQGACLLPRVSQPRSVHM